MTTPERTLADCIQISGRFLRSVNLEKDYASGSQDGDYIVTPTAVEILKRVSEGLSSGSTYRAWTITGPYGVGKSAFAVFLTRLLCQGEPLRASAWAQLEQAAPALARSLGERVRELQGANGLYPLLITARRAPAALCLVEGVRAALVHMRGSQVRTLRDDSDSLIKDIRQGHCGDSRRVVSLLGAFATVADRNGYKGVLLLIDELGKLFEFAARTPQRGDVTAVQEVAEYASRSGAFPVLFLGFLHQSFEAYGQHLDSTTRKEWAKIHGRFEDVAFLEPADQAIRMIASAIHWAPNRRPSPELLRHLRQVARTCVDCGISPPGMRRTELEDLCEKAYPLHPLTVVALPFIFRRFAQNERSLFSYLSSMEPGGFQEFLRSNASVARDPAFVRLDGIFDYFTNNFGAGLFRQPQARRWMEAADVLDRKESLLPLHMRLVKTIGVLGALGDFCHLRADAKMVSAALADATEPPAEIAQGLAYLRERSVLTFRSYNETYRIWEGSDVDIDDRIAEGHRKIHGSISLAAGIQQYLEPRPIVARRHSFEAGALRYFDVVYVDDASQLASRKPLSPGASGQILVCLASGESQLRAFQAAAASREHSQASILLAIPQQMGEIQAAVTELAAMRWAWENTPELRDDRVARREIAMRMAEAEHFLRRDLNALLDPRKEPVGCECLWFWRGERVPVRSRVGVSQLLSTACAKVYDQGTRIRNELIARRLLSSAAAAARRDLVEKMLAAADKPVLGIEGYPPERSMYESVLRNTSLHREIRAGVWGFGEPTDTPETRLTPAWELLHSMVFDADGAPQPVDSVFKRLADPPYGMMDGLLPVVLCAFLQVHRNETTLYREGTFIPEPSIADYEVLMRRPELFAVAGSRVAGPRAAIVDRIAKAVQAPAATVPVVRALFRMVRQLPEVACRTSRLSERTRRVRDAFDKAKVPERFLFVDLPVALGLPPFPDEGTDRQSIDAFFTGLNASLQEWSAIADAIHGDAKCILLRACGFEATDSGWQRFREAATRLEPGESDLQLRQLLRRIVESSADPAGVASVLALVSGRPPASWLDEDIDRFPGLAQAVGEPIRRAMARAGLCGDGAGALNGLAPSQREHARGLARDWAKRLAGAGQQAAPEVMRAALLLLVDELSRDTGNTK